ncbi:MAG TPA: hypothetical protein VF244_10500 [Acidimicrobiales bacterium]
MSAGRPRITVERDLVAARDDCPDPEFDALLGELSDLDAGDLIDRTIRRILDEGGAA